MIKRLELKILPKEVNNISFIKKKASKKLKISLNQINDVIFIRKSIDARNKFNEPKIVILLDVYIDEEFKPEQEIKTQYRKAEPSKSVIIIGAGPAGYFAALKLLEYGIKPIIFERGKDVIERRKDLRQIQQFSIVNSNSNYCFGEGGAGTYSDGKLYTNSKKRGNINQILKILVEHGAKSDILVDTHPHIGSNKLPNIVKNIRNTILEYGGEIYFNSLVTDLIISNKKVKGVKVNNKDEFFSDNVILSTGHSARDIFDLLYRKKIKIEFKPFAIGVRVEHKQSLIDEIQYKQNPRDEYLPPASYKLVTHVDNRGVFSFCMCPGGFIVPSATAPGEIVVNGMSLSRRDSKYANSGIVVSIEKEDLENYFEFGDLAGLKFQEDFEKKIFTLQNDSQQAPAQRMIDFVNDKLSDTLPETSYIPGIYSAPLHYILPEFIVYRLKQAFKDFDKKMNGFYTNDAVLIAIESRTSSPVKIPRDKITLMHEEIKNLYPCGEGAGYAGGIVSAALDGQNVANSIGKSFETN